MSRVRIPFPSWARNPLDEFHFSEKETNPLMRVTSVTVIVSVAFVLLAGCGTATNKFAPPKTMEGRVMVVGNEPFTDLAIAVGEDKVYIIHCDDATRQLLLSNQGKTAIVTYDEIRKTGRGEELEVLSATITSHETTNG